MQEIPSQNIRSGTDFGFKNIALIAVCAAFLVFAGYWQYPGSFPGHFSLFNPVSSSDGNLALATPPKPFDLTLAGGADGVGSTMFAQNNSGNLAQGNSAQGVLAQGNSAQGNLPENNLDQSAGAQTSAVLGATTYDKNFAEQFNSIPLQLIADNSTAALQTYAGQVNAVLQADNAAGLVSAAKKSGAEKNGGLSAAQNKFIQDFQAIAVPDSLLDYARMFIGSYALQFVGDPKLDATISQANSELGIIRQQVRQSSQIALP